jgi:transposase
MPMAWMLQQPGRGWAWRASHGQRRRRRWITSGKLLFFKLFRRFDSVMRSKLESGVDILGAGFAGAAAGVDWVPTGRGVAPAWPTC